MTALREQRWIRSGVVAGAIVQTAATVLVRTGLSERDPGAWAAVTTGWLLVAALAFFGSRLARGLSRQISDAQAARRADRTQIEQLEIRNAILQTIAGSTDVTLTLKALARRIDALVPCDRVGLALARQDGRGFDTFTSRVGAGERRAKPRSELEFPMRGTLVGEVAAGREPRIFPELAALAPEAIDANLLHSSGFRSALMLPLVARKRVVGTLNLVSRRPAAFTPAQVDLLRPIAEIIAVAYVAHQLQASLTRLRTTEAMAELALSTGNEINSALQTIVGHCDLLEQQYPDPALQRDLATVVKQAQRIADLHERMRAAANERLRQVSADARLDEEVDEQEFDPEAVEAIEPDER